ncbi:hypothetical protein FHR84_001405 [Actinopolyspora biskrensis]|uniref:Uncharacterized protein n=1 Tax=Actinopolyspora biskrensis TaxID=1470178 RepID=A0A852Z7B6_9ACTN|nr:hypothetical protein [Actinopolyspora biskrensis]
MGNVLTGEPVYPQQQERCDHQGLRSLVRWDVLPPPAVGFTPNGVSIDNATGTAGKGSVVIERDETIRAYCHLRASVRPALGEVRA